MFKILNAGSFLFMKKKFRKSIILAKSPGHDILPLQEIKTFKELCFINSIRTRIN